MPRLEGIKYFGITLCIVLVGFSSVAQTSMEEDEEASKKEAKDNFAMEDYRRARDEYELLLREDPNDVKTLFRLGLCYLIGNLDDKKMQFRI